MILGQTVPAQRSGIESDLEILTSISKESRGHFAEGMSALNTGRRGEAKVAFDRSVEAFLSAKVDVRQIPKLKDCYEALVETIYRLEFPTPGQRADAERLSTTFGWNQVTATGLTKPDRRNPSRRALRFRVSSRLRLTTFVEWN